MAVLLRELRARNRASKQQQRQRQGGDGGAGAPGGDAGGVRGDALPAVDQEAGAGDGLRSQAQMPAWPPGELLPCCE